eukprot:14980527-Heterocapsa_arctica.AAC.1
MAADTRLGLFGVLTENDKRQIVSEMEANLAQRGSLYSWYELQFWNLRFAASTMTGRERLDKQHMLLKPLVNIENIGPCPPLSGDGGTAKEKSKVWYWTAKRDSFVKLAGCLHRAFAELDTYYTQMGVLDRVATPEEFANKYPNIMDARFRRLYHSTALVLRSPDPVTVTQNINVVAHILNMG